MELKDLNLEDEQKFKEILASLDEDKNERIQELKEQIEEKQEQLNTLENGNDQESYNRYDDALDEQGNISIGNLSYSPSQVLKNTDEVAYNCGYNDYIDNDITELRDEIDNLKEEIKDIIEE